VPLHTALANDGVPLFFDDDDDDDDDAEASSSGRPRGLARGTLAWKRATTLRTTLLSRAPTSIVDDERVSLPRP
jgi:hypothetical protein